MPKKLLKHGKFYKKNDKGELVVYRAGAIVDVTDNQAKNNPDQFVDLPYEKGEPTVSEPQVVKGGKVATPPEEKKTEAPKKPVA